VICEENSATPRRSNKKCEKRKKENGDKLYLLSLGNDGKG
jgi:hypothetical protein